MISIVYTINLSYCLAYDFNGYIRSGAIWSDSGRTSCLQLPGARAKYRLGNECETYGELSISKQFKDESNGSFISYSTMLGFVSDAQDKFDTVTSFWPEGFIETGGWYDNVILKDATFWVGKRYYRRHDVHINDFYYWSNSGYGAGVQDLNLGSSKLAYAYRRNRFVDKLNITGHDLRWYEIKVNKNGQLTVGLDIRNSEDHHSRFAGEQGLQFHLQHTQRPLMGGYNKVALQLGKDIGSDLSSLSANTTPLTNNSQRIVEQLLLEIDQQWSSFFTLIHERQDKVQNWTSLGMRPKYYFNDHLNLAMEIGFDKVKPEASRVRKLSKITFAIQVSESKGFWSRPTLRAFITYADWNTAAQIAGLAGGTSGVFSTDSHGLNYGIQLEHWW